MRGLLFVCIALLQSAQPQTMPISFQKGLQLEQAGDPAGALIQFQQTLRDHPQFDAVLYSVANAELALGRFSDAINHYRGFLRVHPGVYEAYCNLGAALQNLGRLPEAIEGYNHGLALKPDFAEVYSNLGVASHDSGRLHAAVRAFEVALFLRPQGFSEAHFNHGRSLEALKHRHRALQQYTLALRHNPGYPAAHCTRWRLRAALCDWRGYRRGAHAVKALARRSPRQLQGRAPCPEVWDALTYSFLTAKDVLALATLHSQHQARTAPASRRFGPRGGQTRRRSFAVAFVSSDFGAHAVGSVLWSLFKELRFRSVCISTRASDGSKWYSLARNSCTEWHVMENTPAPDVVRRLDAHILIDLNGHSAGASPQLILQRGAPVQLQWLGCASPSGRPAAIDGIMLDYVVLPPSLAGGVSEKVVFVPHSYHFNSHEQEHRRSNLRSSKLLQTSQGIAELFAVPVGKLLLSCFNALHKITPNVWRVWNGVLRRSAHSVLWMLRFPAAADAPDRLKLQMLAEGVQSTRLHMSDLFPAEQHIKVKGVADMFLDTFPFSAHSSAIDSLWGKVPIVTVAGETIASRVALSVIAAVLPEWAASAPSTMKEMEDLAMLLIDSN
eukprot:TRINITY_DN7804_c0_g1_i1.p1 TRINITY_DN7804_c0_g1~~TRINITY_DN7804_c0_g1_i1.p1  ORF type:complete len:612 (+),score=123.15 TRINITY_DN7804_c0_g1_i1:198-2033(+)